MRIGIDARALSHGFTSGIHRYVASLVPALLQVGEAHEFVLYADAKHLFELADLSRNATLRTLAWRGQMSSVKNDLFMNRAMSRDKIEVAFFPANYGFAPRRARAVVTMHDQINLMPLHGQLTSRGSVHTLRGDAMTVYVRACQFRSAHLAAKLITISNYSRREIARFLPRAEIVTVLHGLLPTFRVLPRDAAMASAPRVELPARFILADALKNPDAVVGAWRRLSDDLRRDTRIVFFARTTRLLPVVAESVAAGEAILIVRPTDDELIALFNLADVFVFPSWLEGFGLPALEAMACGAPVIASSTTALPEVVGDAGLLAPPDDHAALAECLQRVLSDAELAAELRARGFARAKTFTWQRAAAETLCVIESVG